ncbi:MAG: transketolase family protein [Spirochaetales bacterium]|nr:transketolase family protein [Spirochaetales bacterium]
MAEEIRDSFVNELREIKKTNKELVVLVSDSTSTCRIKPFLEDNPEAVINVGIAEQNLIGMAAGMALGGFTPVTANAAPFLMGRSNEQVKNDICYSETNVKLVGLNPGFAYGSLGPTHHCLDDVSTALSFGNIQVFVPSDPEETRQITRYAVNHIGPVYIRLDSYKADNIHKDGYRFVPGESVVIKEGSDLTIVVLGTMIHTALTAAAELEKQGVQAEVISLPSIRPLQPEGILQSIGKTGNVLTVEEHSLHGGIGSIVAELVLEHGLSCKFKKLGVPAGSFAPASPRSDIQEEYNLHSDGIIQEALRLLNRTKNG